MKSFIPLRLFSVKLFVPLYHNLNNLIFIVIAYTGSFRALGPCWGDDVVIDPRIYKEQVEELGVEGLEINPSNREEALELLEEVEGYIKNLKRIRYNLHMDMRIIRRQYLERMRDPEVKGDLRKRKSILDERDDILGPYEGVDRMIDALLEELDESAQFLREYAGLEDTGVASDIEGW